MRGKICSGHYNVKISVVDGLNGRLRDAEAQGRADAGEGGRGVAGMTTVAHIRKVGGVAAKS